ncbi:hypothetical protein BC829DRAFT_395831 [Chytridium lagenaria]|nr:hypothetical protein BC829DRAFT_395831 [Chytridium lagenaria]
MGQFCISLHFLSLLMTMLPHQHLHNPHTRSLSSSTYHLLPHHHPKITTHHRCYRTSLDSLSLLKSMSVVF